MGAGAAGGVSLAQMLALRKQVTRIERQLSSNQRRIGWSITELIELAMKPATCLCPFILLSSSLRRDEAFTSSEDCRYP